MEAVKVYIIWSKNDKIKNFILIFIFKILGLGPNGKKYNSWL